MALCRIVRERMGGDPPRWHQSRVMVIEGSGGAI